MSIPTPSQFMNSLIMVNDDQTVVRHKLNAERAYLVSPDSDADEVITLMKARMGFFALVVFVLTFSAYVLISSHLFGDTYNYKNSPETMVYAPAFICSLIVTLISIRYANIMYRDGSSLSIPTDLIDSIDEGDAELLFLANANGELDSALSSLRSARNETDDPEAFEGP